MAPNNTFRAHISEIDLRLLRVFKTVAECGGFAAAEVKLNKSKSAISSDIADLENRLQARLCRRGRAGFHLTPAGERIHQAIAELLEDMDRFRDKVNRARDQLSGELSIFVTDNIVTHDQSPLVQAVAIFARRHPKVFLQLTSAPAGEVQQAILDGRADMGVSILPRPQPSLEMVPLFDEVLHLYCGRMHPLFERPAETVDLETLAAHRMIETAVVNNTELAEQLRDRVSVTARASSIDARVIMILSGEFLGFLPTAYAAPWVAREEMKALRPDRVSTANTFHAIFNRSAPANVIVEQFRAILLAEFGLVPPPLAAAR